MPTLKPYRVKYSIRDVPGLLDDIKQIGNHVMHIKAYDPDNARTIVSAIWSVRPESNVIRFTDINEAV